MLFRNCIKKRYKTAEMLVKNSMFGVVFMVVLVRSLPNPCLETCQVGTKCYLGKCVSVELLPVSCGSNLDCLPTQSCSGGVCVKNSLVPPCVPSCKSGEKCSRGKCVAVPIKICNQLCIEGFQCVDGKCVPVDKCAAILCAPGTTCRNGICIPISIKPCTKLCIKGTHCVNGQCIPIIPDLNVCPADAFYQTKACTNPRPTDKTCPIVYYIRAPDPLFCGVTADGTRINFFEQCTTCKDPRIIYYFTKPCHEVPFVCQAGETCNDYYCSASCSTDEECPYDWQICNLGQCIDRCAVMRCATGPCKFGQCAYEEPSGACTLGAVSGCKKDSWSCVGFQCVDLCVRQACQPNERCNQGNCQPIL